MNSDTPWKCEVNVGGDHRVHASGATPTQAIQTALAKAETFGKGPFPYLVSKDASPTNRDEMP